MLCSSGYFSNGIVFSFEFMVQQMSEKGKQLQLLKEQLLPKQLLPKKALQEPEKSREGMHVVACVYLYKMIPKFVVHNPQAM